MKAPSGFGSTGVNGSKVKDFVVSKPALVAAEASTKGVNAATAWAMRFQQLVLS